jgi:glycine betaine catabolism B
VHENAGATITVLDNGSVTADALLAAVPDLASRRAYVSGAPSLVADAATALRRAGARRVRTDYFAGY